MLTLGRNQLGNAHIFLAICVVATSIQAITAARLPRENSRVGLKWRAIDPLATVQQLAECLYNNNDVACVDQYCQPTVAVHGDGVWLPQTTFSGAEWVKAIHKDWFAEYSDWNFKFLDVAATAAVKGYTEVLGFFHWAANNTGSYHGLPASGQRSQDYGLMHATVDRQGLVTDVITWRAGFREERQGLLLQPGYDDTITPLHDITDQPFWVPSQSLQLKMNTRAHALLEVLNQGEKFLDTLDDICIQGVLLLDGMHIWGPARAEGLTALKLWMAGWLQRYDVNAAVTASVATPTSNKVFVCFKLVLTDSSIPSSQALQGCLLYVFNIQGFITHLVIYRNGTPQEMSEKFIGRGVGNHLAPVRTSVAALARTLLARQRLQQLQQQQQQQQDQQRQQPVQLPAGMQQQQQQGHLQA